VSLYLNQLLNWFNPC